MMVRYDDVRSAKNIIPMIMYVTSLLSHWWLLLEANIMRLTLDVRCIISRPFVDMYNCTYMMGLGRFLRLYVLVMTWIITKIMETVNRLKSMRN